MAAAFCLPEDERELGELSPSFMWLLRDFYFELEDEGRRVRGLLVAKRCVLFVGNRSWVDVCYDASMRLLSSTVGYV